jgi:hypothetical protein
MIRTCWNWIPLRCTILHSRICDQTIIVSFCLVLQGIGQIGQVVIRHDEDVISGSESGAHLLPVTRSTFVSFCLGLTKHSPHARLY